MASQKNGILFLGVSNASRSQMAEGFARKLFGARVAVQSAGNHPTRIDLYAVAVMREVGIDIAGEFAKPFGSLDVKNLGTVITLCKEDVCPPSLSELRQLRWPFEDPAAFEPGLMRDEVLERFRDARDGIREKLEEFKRTEGL